MKAHSLFLVAVAFFFSRDAFGYIDPGSGQLILQLLIGVLVGSLFYLKQIRLWVMRVVFKKKPPAPPQEAAKAKQELPKTGTDG